MSLKLPKEKIIGVKIYKQFIVLWQTNQSVSQSVSQRIIQTITP